MIGASKIMQKNKNSFYITTPIYYVTAKPHLGSLYSTVIADTIARYHIQRKKEVFFLTGTDEHGQKIAEAAQQEGKQPEEFIKFFIPEYQNIWKLFHIDYSYFMRTTFEFHKTAVQSLLRKLLAQGDIYKSQYQGWYCTPCETFVSQKKEIETEVVLCPSCSRKTVLISEDSYFFKLSSYQEKLLDFYEKNPHFIIPKERVQEVIQFVKEGLKDISISRTAVSWGVPFPDNPEHSVYVWIEALCNYITAIGYGQPEKQEQFEKFWPADIHVIGKDIVRFHAIYWPALLFAAQLPAPRQLLVHGWITVDHQKMSKSLGNIVDPEQLAKKYHVDTVRYYLLRYLPITQDGDFSYTDLKLRNNTDLANDLGNLLQRIVTLYKKGNFVRLTPYFDSGLHCSVKSDSLLMICAFEEAMEQGMFHLALAATWRYIQSLNAFFHNNEPWKQLQDNRKFCEEILWISCYGLYVTALVLHPIMPEKMDALLFSLGIQGESKNTHIHEIIKGNWAHQFELVGIPPLFEKYELKEEKPMEQKEQKIENMSENTITFDEFAKIQLRIGMIQSCTEVPKSNKLLLLQVDFGAFGVRQVVSGIKEYFSSEFLLGKQALFVYNLEPRVIFGHQSHGMILLATDEKGVKTIMQPEKIVALGTMLQ